MSAMIRCKTLILFFLVVCTYASSHDDFPEGFSAFHEFPEDPIFGSTSHDRFLKKIPREDKNFKKDLTRFYTITERDMPKYREMILKSGLPYCKEIRVTPKDSERTSETKEKICYKCKNPRTGETYEQCSFTSSPEDSEFRETTRTRRSNSGSDHISSDFGKPDSPYRFDETIFADASAGIPEKYRKDNEKCEKVKRDSMVCMVCEDTKSNSKYEQCSYVGKPDDKMYSYEKSSSFGKPRTEEASEDSDDDSKHEKSNPEDSPTENCREVRTDSKICTICGDPKTGDNYEKCSYVYKPNDKIYKFSRSKSFGYPRSDSESSRETDYSESRTEEAPSDYRKSESERQESQKDCKEVRKGSLTCVVCKNPEKGGKSERCSYSYEPDNKMFSYRKSSSFNRDKEPEESTTEGHFSSESKTEEVKTTPETSQQFAKFSDAEKKREEIEKFLKEFQNEDRSNCEKVLKDKMTCYRCKDEKGFQKEECVFVGAEKPEDKAGFKDRKMFGVEEDEFAEPSASGSEQHEKREKPDEETEDLKEAEPYEYTMETRPIYDKILGFTLPEYMLVKSEHEAEFDEVVASSRA